MHCIILTTIAIACGVAIASAQQSKPNFEVASVKYVGDRPPVVPPTRTAPNVFYRFETVETFIRLAYGFQHKAQVIGGPDWIRRRFFEINARAAEETSREQMPLMLQSLLHERFRLVVREEQREMPAYTLVVARDDGRVGPGLMKCDPTAALKPPPVPRGSMMFRGRCVPIASIVSAATGAMNAPLIDKSGLTGTWTYFFYYLQPNLPPGRVPDENLRPFDAALRQELGLKLEPTHAFVDVIVVESIEQPTEN